MARRTLITLGSALAGLLLATGTVAAGGWATINADPGNPPDPNAGETVRLGFDVLQHGVTPVSWPGATVIVRNAETGETLSVPASPEGPAGHYVADVAFPSAGQWTWRVELTDLIVETGAAVVEVAGADGSVPPLTAGAIERVRADVIREVQDGVGADVAEQNRRLAALEARSAALERIRSGSEPAGETGPAAALVPLLFVAALLGGLVGAGMMAFIRGQTANPREIAPTYVPTTR